MIINIGFSQNRLLIALSTWVGFSQIIVARPISEFAYRKLMPKPN